MKNKIYILGLIAFILAGCYEDKGNYDYKKVNGLESITFTPEPEITENSYNYKYRQPAVDSLRVTYTPIITQSEAEDESNLEYQWVLSKTVDKKTVLDTVFSKELLLKFPPKKASSFSPLFRVIDHSTGVEYYRQFSMKTEVPFVTSWFVLHGQPGDRKLGVIEGVNKNEDEPLITYDVYKDIWGVRRFQNATRLLYCPSDGSDYTARTVEHLTVIGSDSCSYMHAFDLVVAKRFELMMPSVSPRPRLAYGIGDETGAGTMLVDESGHLYWAKGNGWYFVAKTNEDTENYITDKVFMSLFSYVVVWDKVHKQFMYYSMSNNPWVRDDSEIHPEDQGSAVLKLFEEGVFEEGEWDNQEVLYLGQGNSEMSKEGACVVAKDNKQNYIVYQIGFNGQGGNSFIEVNKVPATSMKLDEDSQFATSIAFMDQIFYTRGSAVYLYNMVSGEEIYLYDAGGPITKLKFRIARWYDSGYGTIDANKRLAIVVDNPDGTGELHEIFLDAAGDIEKTLVHTGFGSIQDIVFSTPGIMRY